MAHSLAVTKICPDIKFQGTMVIELREFNDKKKKNMDKMGKLFLLITLTKNGISVK